MSKIYLPEKTRLHLDGVLNRQATLRWGETFELVDGKAVDATGTAWKIVNGTIENTAGENLNKETLRLSDLFIGQTTNIFFIVKRGKTPTMISMTNGIWNIVDLSTMDLIFSTISESELVSYLKKVNLEQNNSN